MKSIELINSDKIVLVDDSDYEIVSGLSWREHNKGYAVANGGATYMHRLITGAPPECDVDHKDHNKLNNQRYNLRVCTQSQNSGNSVAHKDRTHTKFKGVTWDKSRSKWKVHICVSGKKTNVGRFDSEIEAAMAYNNAAKNSFGEFAHLNEIPNA